MPPKKDKAPAAARKQKKFIRDSIQGITRGALRRLMILAAYSAGVSQKKSKDENGKTKASPSIRMTSDCTYELRTYCKLFAEDIARVSSLSAESMKRKTIMRKDIEYASKFMNKQYYFPQSELDVVRNTDELKKAMKKGSDGILVVPRASLSRFLREVYQDYGEFNLSKSALLCLRVFVERELIKVLKSAILNMVTLSNRTTLTPNDIRHAAKTQC